MVNRSGMIRGSDPGENVQFEMLASGNEMASTKSVWFFQPASAPAKSESSLLKNSIATRRTALQEQPLRRAGPHRGLRGVQRRIGRDFAAHHGRYLAIPWFGAHCCSNMAAKRRTTMPFASFLREHGLDYSRFGCASVQLDGGLENVTEKVVKWFAADKAPAATPRQTASAIGTPWPYRRTWRS